MACVGLELTLRQDACLDDCFQVCLINSDVFDVLLICRNTNNTSECPLSSFR